MLQKLTALLLVLALLAFPAAASENTLAVCKLEELPESWEPYGELTPSQQFLLDMTMEPVSGLCESITDVSAQYTDAPRGYAFQIDLTGSWEDGSPVTADQVISSVRACFDADPQSLLWLKNARGILSGETTGDSTPVTLAAAGFDTLSQAMDAGFSKFYLDTTAFWGLDEGWRAIEDREPLKDSAMTSGMPEYYVNSAYLYRNYLAPGAAYDRWQGEFLGVSLESGEALTTEDLGIQKTGERQLVIFTENPTALSALELKLGTIYPASSMACGPYRVESFHNGALLLVENEAYSGTRGMDYPAQILCRAAP